MNGSHIPIVTLELKKRYGFYSDSSSLDILTSGLIGEQYIRLKPGFIDEETELLADGDYIEDTKSALVLEDLIGQILYRFSNTSE